MKVLVTGGSGYIGSHVVIELIESGYDVVVIDNLANSSKESILRIEQLTGKEIPFFYCDIRDEEALTNVFSKETIDCCIHFAGLKAVGESMKMPRKYYDNNISGTLTLLKVMEKSGCRNIIFSSTANVYGEPDSVPISEEAPKKRCTNPYGNSKSIIEDILMDIYAANKNDENEKKWNILLLRYFNPIGAHPSGLIGEAPSSTPNNLMPFITQVAIGNQKELKVYGNDYDTPDGTCIRDYIHIVDLAKGHVKALNAIRTECGLDIYNLGTGIGYSVLDLVRTFEYVNSVEIPYIITGRREGDIAVCYANPNKAFKELGWRAEYSLEEMCRDSWNWQKKNPFGYGR